MLYNDYSHTKATRRLGALEIALQAREHEKEMAIRSNEFQADTDYKTNSSWRVLTQLLSSMRIF